MLHRPYLQVSGQTNYYSSINFYKRNPSAPRQLIRCTDFEDRNYRQILNIKLVQIINSRREHKGAPTDERGYATFFQFEAGEGNHVVPESYSDATSTKFGVINPDYETRSRETNEMIVSPYKVGTLKVLYKDGVDYTTVGEHIFRGNLISLLGLVPEKGQSPYIDGAYKLPGTDVYFSSWNNSEFFVRGEILDKKLVRIFDLLNGRKSARLLADTVLGIETNQFKRLITSTHAEANMGFLDLATTIAEMPDTLKMCLGALKALREMLSDFKNKKFSLTRAHERSQKRRDSAHDRLLQQLQDARDLAISLARGRPLSDKAKAFLIRKEERLYQQRLNRLNKEAKRRRKEAAIELADAIANVWMTYRYGIMPVVMTIEDAIALQKAINSTFITTRNSTMDIGIKLFDLSDDWSATELLAYPKARCMIKRRVTDGNPKKGADKALHALSLTGQNLIATWWELISKSFVADWFLNVGDFVKALAFVKYFIEEASTFSIQCTETYLVTHKSGASIEVLVNLYDRRVINPSDHTGLTLAYDMNPYRYADSIAMLWSSVKRKL